MLEGRGRHWVDPRVLQRLTNGPLCTHFVALRVGQDWVLCCQGNAAGCDHQEDTHLKVAQVYNVVAGPPDPVCGRRVEP